MGEGSNYSTAYFSLAKKAEKADGYQTTVTGVQGLSQTLPITALPTNQETMGRSKSLL